VDIHGLEPATDSPLLIMLDLHGNSVAIDELFSELSGSQTGGEDGYSLTRVGPGYDAAPPWVKPISGDSEFLAQFTNISGAGDRYFNFDWSAGNSGVTLDQITVVPEPTSVALVSIAGIFMLHRPRKKKLRFDCAKHH